MTHQSSISRRKASVFVTIVSLNLMDVHLPVSMSVLYPKPSSRPLIKCYSVGSVGGMHISRHLNLCCWFTTAAPVILAIEHSSSPWSLRSSKWLINSDHSIRLYTAGIEYHPEFAKRNNVVWDGRWPSNLNPLTRFFQATRLLLFISKNCRYLIATSSWIPCRYILGHRRTADFHSIQRMISFHLSADPFLNYDHPSMTPLSIPTTSDSGQTSRA